MKLATGIITLFFFVSFCSEKKGTTPKQQDQNEKPQLWVTYRAQEAINGKTILLVSGDEEYRSEEALPQLAKILSQRHGFNCTVLFAQNPNRPGIVNPNYRKNIPGLHLLEQADLVIWFTRFRELPVTQMGYIDTYLRKGKPLIAIRTATHAFNFEDRAHPFAHYGWNYEGEKKNWHFGFGKRILGETWFTHHGNHKHQSTRGIVPKEMVDHPILNGIENGSIWGATDVYGIRTPLAEDAQILVLGQTIDRAAPFDANDLHYGMRETDTLIAHESGPKDKRYHPNTNMPPIVWSTSFQLTNGKKGKALASTIGAATDMLDEEVRRLFVNASYDLLNLPVPENSNVETVGAYHPSQYGFHDDEHWVKRHLKVSDFGKE